MNRLNWEKFRGRFHESWWVKMKPFIESSECFQIYKHLKECPSTIFPKSGDMWRAFKYTDYTNLKSIWVGMSPYHTSEKGLPLADGMAFSASYINKEPPSLRVLFDAMEDDLGRKINRNPDLNYLAFQDVLLLNSSLAVKSGIPDSFRELFQPFLKYLFTKVLDTVTGIPIILFGGTAQEEVEHYLDEGSQPYLCVRHPSYFNRKEIPMVHKNLFTYTNQVLKDNNNTEIYWDYDDYLEHGLPF